MAQRKLTRHQIGGAMKEATIAARFSSLATWQYGERGVLSVYAERSPYSVRILDYLCHSLRWRREAAYGKIPKHGLDRSMRVQLGTWQSVY